MLELPSQTGARPAGRSHGLPPERSFDSAMDLDRDRVTGRELDSTLTGNALTLHQDMHGDMHEDMHNLLPAGPAIPTRAEIIKPGVWPWVVGAAAAIALASSVNSDLVKIKNNLTASMGDSLSLLPALPGDAIATLLDGRDLTLSGQIAGEDRRSQLVEQLRSIPGMRVVRDDMQAFDARKQAKLDKLAFQQALEQTDSSAIAFEPSSSALSSQSLGALEKLAALLRDSSERQIKITGHTDNSGNPQANLRISRERAQSVANALTNMGVLQQQLIVQGFGHTQPLYSNDTETGRAKNRRIEFIFMK